jgi:hypothetical protein
MKEIFLQAGRRGTVRCEGRVNEGNMQDGSFTHKKTNVAGPGAPDI